MSFFYIYSMKKISFILGLLIATTSQAQFKISVDAPQSFTPKEAYLYTLNGSKDVLNGKELRKGNTWQFNISTPYSGMMKLYFQKLTPLLISFQKIKMLK